MKALLLATLLFLASCTAHKRPYTVPQPKAVLRALNFEKATALRSQGKVDAIFRKGKRIKLKVFMIADRSGRIRFDAVTPPPLNATVLLLTSDGQTVRANDKRSKRYFEGVAGVCAVRNLLGLPLTPSQLFSMLIGEPAVHNGVLSLSWDSSCGCEVVTAKDGDTTAKIWVLGHKGRAHWRVVKQVLTSPKGRVKVEYRGYKKHQGVWVPYRIRISKPGTRSDTIFAWSKLELNPELEVEAFNQVPPPGVPIQRLICGEGEAP